MGIPPSLLPDRALTPEERAAIDEDPRPGVWAGEFGADLRQLSQDETDALIRAELWQEVSSRGDDIGEAQGALGAWREVLRLFNGAPYPLRVQRGGLDSDPLVRLLAYRAWGNRDRQWASGPRSRISTGLLALDHTLGGGLVEGSTTLFAGWPGTGKSTLTLQMLEGLGQRCLYVTGEEPRERVVARGRRVGVTSDRIHVLAEQRLEVILERARALNARALAIDTVQMLSCSHVRGSPGLPAQLRECTTRLIDYARG